MICPECRQGMVQIKASTQISGRAWFKTIPCPKCYGSGIAYCCNDEDTNPNPVAIYHDQASVREAGTMVA